MCCLEFGRYHELRANFCPRKYAGRRGLVGCAGGCGARASGCFVWEVSSPPSGGRTKGVFPMRGARCQGSAIRGCFRVQPREPLERAMGLQQCVCRGVLGEGGSSQLREVNTSPESQQVAPQNALNRISVLNMSLSQLKSGYGRYRRTFPVPIFPFSLCVPTLRISLTRKEK